MSERYRVEPTGKGFWPYCVRAGDGSRELFVGHKKSCDVVAAELTTAFRDGESTARRERDQLRAELGTCHQVLNSIRAALHDSEVFCLPDSVVAALSGIGSKAPQQPNAVSVPRELEALQAECDNLRISLKDADHGMVLFMQQRDELHRELESIKRHGLVSVPVDLLKRSLRADASKGAGAAQMLDGWAAMEELRALLSTRQAEEGE